MSLCAYHTVLRGCHTRPCMAIGKQYLVWLPHEALRDVHTLMLVNTSITDKGLSHLRHMTQLSNLRITFGKISGKISGTGLAHLKKLSGLTTLILDNTNISDAGLVHMKKLPNLEYLSLSRSEVTNEGIAELRKALPDCKISPGES